jgi:hypothetical protein
MTDLDGADSRESASSTPETASGVEVAVGAAVDAAKDAYNDTPENPFDHGFAHMDVDGRTSLAHALREHPDVDASDTSYITIDGLSRYLTPQRKGYRAFVDTLDDYGVDTGQVTVYGHLD